MDYLHRDRGNGTLLSLWERCDFILVSCALLLFISKVSTSPIHKFLSGWLMLSVVLETSVLSSASSWREVGKEEILVPIEGILTQAFIAQEEAMLWACTYQKPAQRVLKTYNAHANWYLITKLYTLQHRDASTSLLDVSFSGAHSACPTLASIVLLLHISASLNYS